MPTARSTAARGLTFARFAAQQLRSRKRIASEIEAVESAPFIIHGPITHLTGSETMWRPTGLHVCKGESFVISARGSIWLSEPLSVVVEPKSMLWLRLGGTQPIAKPAQNDHVFEAWADGEVGLFLKGLSEWASPAGDLISAARAATKGSIRVCLRKTDWPATPSRAPNGWRYLWRLGDGSIYSEKTPHEISIDTHGDVGILQRDVDHVLTPNTRLTWSWLVDELPSRLPEDIRLTHDYLSVAVEFEDGRDLTYMWSAGLPHDHIFACPLGFWCDWETHWVIRTARDGLGKWHSESRRLWDDTEVAYGARPVRAVRLWLIANTVFQRRRGRATVRDLTLSEGT
jgi:hypothetical protein